VVVSKGKKKALVVLARLVLSALLHASGVATDKCPDGKLNVEKIPLHSGLRPSATNSLAGSGTLLVPTWCQPGGQKHWFG